MSYEVVDFQQDVMHASAERPVVVDFWAAWCGPCRTLGPILESLAERCPGQWKLVTINVDQHQELASRFGVRGIPAVKMIHQGQVVGEFTGAMPEADVIQWLQNTLPSEVKTLFHQAGQCLEQADSSRAIQLLEQVLAREPNHDGARATLAREVLWEDPERASGLLTQPAGDPDYTSLFEQARALLQLVTLTEQNTPDGKGKAALTAAAQAAGQRDWSSTLERLIDSITVDKGYQEELARRCCIALFHWWGNGHELTRAYRRRFEMSLY